MPDGETDLFAGSTHYYARYRPRYPEVMLHDLVAVTVAGRGDLLLDLGCGTGEVAIPLSAYFDRVVAADMDAEMVALARAKAAEQGISTIEWLVARAESLPFTDGDYDLVTAGSSFHWMDRAYLVGQIHRALITGGALGLIGGGSSPWKGTSPWHGIAVDVIKRWLGEKRRAGSGTFAVNKVHEDFLVPAGFRIETRDYRAEHVWTIDAIVGFLYSTSFAGPGVLGSDRAAFERDLRAELLAQSPGGTFHELLNFQLIIGFKD